MNPKTQYRILRTQTLKEMEEQTGLLASEGWQPAGPVTELKKAESNGIRFFHEMVRFVNDDQANVQAEMQIAADLKAFEDRYEQMDQKVKDLLEINGISLIYVDGKYYTKTKDKVFDGITPEMVLNLLKNSNHYPIDQDDSVVLNAIKGLV